MSRNVALGVGGLLSVIIDHTMIMENSTPSALAHTCELRSSKKRISLSAVQFDLRGLMSLQCCFVWVGYSP